jgi:hypothetical protein
MRKNTLSPAVLVLACSITLNSMAQYDSSRLDAGYLSFKKEFTQTITIKGSDLEKMPFANLSDALSAWLYGAYTQPGSLQYVVDGNPVSDVNAYSVYDIDEVVLVQNAAALALTPGGPQELVLVRTRRGRGKGGFTGAAQTGLVNASGNGVNTDTRIYHNYYVGVWRNLDKLSFGISGNYLRDVFPLPADGKTIVTPDNLQRERLNGYLTWRPDNRNQVEVTMNYTPEQLGYGTDSLAPASTYQASSTQAREKAHQHFLLPHLLWHSDFARNWTNDFQATYLLSKYTENDQLLETPLPNGNPALPGETGLGLEVDKENSYHVWIRDRVAYTASAGGWRIEPSLNLSYENLKEEFGYSELTEIQTGFGNTGLGGFGGVSTATSAGTQAYKTNDFFITPTIDFSYKKALDIQGGVLANVAHQAGGGRKVFPFASLSLDLLRLGGGLANEERGGLGNEESGAGLKIFGSYSQRAAAALQDFALADLSNGLDPGINLLSPSVFSLIGFGYTGIPTGQAPPGIPIYWAWETGASYSGWKDRLTIQYNFERRNTTTVGEVFVTSPPGSGNPGYTYFIYPEWTSTRHHADIRIKILDGAPLSWQSGLNVTLLRSRIDSPSTYLIVKPDMGEVYPNAYSWTGGWVNRVQVKDVTAGLDLLYHFGETTYIANGGTSRLNSVLVPNLYIGYRCHLAHAETLEFFVESRGLIRSRTSDLPDERRYYTAGGKFSL